MNFCMRYLQKFLKEKSGVSALEFALVLPVLLLCLLGIIDVSRYMHFNQKMDNTINTLSLMVNKNTRITEQEIKTYHDLIPSLMTPYDIKNLSFILTGVEQMRGKEQPEVIWQIHYGTKSRKSKVARKGEGAVVKKLPITLAEDEQLTILEVYNDFELTFDVTSMKEMLSVNTNGIYRKMISRPRYGSFEENPV
ncbi:MAG: TadE/TadG family type IV pilus assembly protein [Pseudomonadota bacterium]